MTISATNAARATAGSGRHAEAANGGKPGLFVRFVRRDPVRAVAILLITVQLAWRTEICARGYLQEDGFILASRATGSDLTLDFLLTIINNHLMPAGWLVVWLVTKAVGLEYWPYVALLTLAQAVLSIAFYRLLRLMFRPGWALLIPLSLLLFNPLELAGTTSWFGGLNSLPMQFAMVTAIGAQFKYARTRRMRHLVSLGASLVVGLLFFEKSLLIAPLVFLVTACFLVDGGPVRSVLRAMGRFWPSWTVLGALSGSYLFVYFDRAAQTSVRSPASVAEVLTFLRDLVGFNLVPGLMGGPWNWVSVGDGPPLAAPDNARRWLVWLLFLGLVVVTVAVRREATRAWVLLALYLAMIAALFSATRLNSPLSGAAGLAPRYINDVVLVAIICIGVATLGLRDSPPRDRPSPFTWPAILSGQGGIAATTLIATTLVALLGYGSAVTSAGFSDNWAIKRGRDYLHTAQAELAKAPPDTVFFDQPVPLTVMPAFVFPDNLQSAFFRPAKLQPHFVSETDHLSVFTQTGLIAPARIDGISTAPGPAAGCGYPVGGGQTVRLPLSHPVNVWDWAAHIGYLSSGDSPVLVRIGDATYELKAKSGLQELFFLMPGSGGDAVSITVRDPSVTVCVDVVTIGSPAPKK